MKGSLNRLFRKIADGNSIMGAYYRRSVTDNSNIKFDCLTVITAEGVEYETTSPAESAKFFQTVTYTGTGVNSGREENCYYYESNGGWHS